LKLFLEVVWQTPMNELSSVERKASRRAGKIHADNLVQAERLDTLSKKTEDERIEQLDRSRTSIVRDARALYSYVWLTVNILSSCS